MVRCLLAGLVGTLLIASAGAASYRVVVYHPAWSPDGRRIAYVQAGSPARLVVMSAKDGSDKRTVYSSTDACCGGPVQWSSVHQIVFDDDYHVKTADLSNGRLRGLKGGFSDFIVSRDGRWIAGWPQGGPRNPEWIGVVSVKGSGFRWLSKQDQTVNDSQPDFSPDGKQVVFAHSQLDKAGEPVGQPSIVIEPTTGGPVRDLGVSGLSPRWSPDGRWIAFDQVGVHSSYSGLAVVPVAGGSPRILARVSNGYGFYSAFSWSPDSKRLAFATYTTSGSSPLWTVDLSGHLRQFNLGALSALHGDAPTFSPDGKRIAFTGLDASHGPNSRSGIYVIGSDGHDLRRLA